MQSAPLVDNYISPSFPNIVSSYRQCMVVISNGTYWQLCAPQSWILIRHYNVSIPDNWQLIIQSNVRIPGNWQLSPVKPSIQPYAHCPSCLSHSFLTHVSHLYSQLTPYVPEVHSGKKMLKFREIQTLISTNILHHMRSLKF